MMEREKRRSCDGDSEEGSDGVKRTKSRDLESLLQSEGVRNCNLDFLKKKEGPAILRPCSREEISQITVDAASMLLDSCPDLNGTCLSLGHTGTKMSSALNGRDDPTKETIGWNENVKVVEKEEAGITKPMELRLDLNTVDGSCVADHNPFYPYKKLGQMKIADASECGSTTGPVEENEPLRKWNEMKQNGSLSLSSGSMTIPKPRRRWLQKRKDDELNSKSGDAQEDQVNRLIKVAAPSGLLSGLNPGIINHVRNSKQVYSILEVMVRSAMLDNQNHQHSISGMRQASKEVGDRRIEDSSNRFDTSTIKKSVPQSIAHMSEQKFCQEKHANSRFTSEDDDGLKLKLSLAATTTPENTSQPSAANPEYITTLSLKAAIVASHWLELLQEDVKGRIAALKRSWKRVRNAIHTELPYLLSTEFVFDQESKPSLVYCPTGSSEKVVSEMHVGRWTSLFSQMEKALNEDGRRLENWLSQVRGMQLSCERGLRYVGSDGLLPGSIGESSKLKKSEAFERECAAKAAAASIYSTCNLIMTAHEV